MEIDAGLRKLLRRWSAPEPGADLDRRMIEKYRSLRGQKPGRSLWTRLRTGSIPVPIPAAILALILAALGAWRVFIPAAPRVIVRTERVEVPVVTERLVPQIIYRTRVVNAAPKAFGPDAQELRPVSELRPVFIRRGE